MKKLKIILLLIVIASCSQPEQKQTPFPITAVSEDARVVFEGTILSDNEIEVKAELSLIETSVGLERDFELNKTIETKQVATGGISKGKYAISYGLPENEKGLTLTDEVGHIQKTTIDKTLSQDGIELRKKIEKYGQDLATAKVYSERKAVKS